MKKSDTPFLDRVILHNKNADERLFDMILRIITFIVLIIIVWIYADLTHVKADGVITNDDIEFTTLSDYTGKNCDEIIMFSSNITDYLTSRTIDTTYVNLGGFYSNYEQLINSQTYITESFLNNLPIPTHIQKENIDANGKRWNIDFNTDNCNINVKIARITDSVFEYNVIFIQPEQFMLSLNDIAYNTTGDYSWDNIYGFKFWVNIIYDVNQNSYTASIAGTRYDSSYSSTNLFSDAPIYGGYGTINNIVTNFVNNDYQEVLDPKTSYVLNLNYVNALNLIDNTPKESNLNHLSLNDIQVGLSCNRKNQSLESSNIIIGVDVDDWISNHMKSYNLKVDYDINFNAQFNGVNSPLNGHYTSTQLNNLALFNNDAYSYGVSEIANDSNFPLTSLNSQDIKVYSNSQPYYGLFPTILNYVQKEISNEWSVWTPSTGHNIVFNDFTLTVTCTLYSGLDYGGSYIKEFDFLTGAESIKRADILTNNNPWLGDPSPQLPSNVPESGITNNNGGYGGGNTSVNVNVSGQKIPMNVQNQQEINNTLTNYTNAFETFSNSIRSLADTESQNNFYAVLSNTVPMIPGVNIFLQYVALTCGVMLILLVLKILLF